ncbi:MAG: hypothetical protein KC543_16145 [Myxococcales bacterium]|nr:hypothetical protein [Myxococcales bacterium]
MLWLIRHALCDLYPSTDELPGIEQASLDEFLRRFRRETNRATWAGVVLGAWAYTAAPILTVGMPAPSFLLSRRLRELHAERMGSAPFYVVRQLTFVLKMVAGLCWGADPEVRARMNLPPLPGDPGTWRTE